MLNLVEEALDGLCVCNVGGDDPHIININYPAAFSDDYLRPAVLLEIGPLASWLPYEERRISCYATDQFLNVYKEHVMDHGG